MALISNPKDSPILETSFLFETCRQGDLKVLEIHLNPVSSTTICLIRDENHATLIHYASRYGHLHILRYFLEIKHIDIAQLLTQNGATCAHDAAVCNQLAIIKQIFFHYKRYYPQHIDWTTAKDEQGNTLLHLAAYYKSLDVMYYLLEEEYADPDCQTFGGVQPIHYAAECGHTQGIVLLLKKSPNTVNQRTNQGLTPLHLAVKIGSIETLQVLVSFGGDYRLRTQHGLNCLHIACQHNHFDILQWLVEERFAEVNDVDYMNNTLMHYAAATGNELMINYLLDRNVRISTNNNGNTPLHIAAKHGRRNACALLIDRFHWLLTAVNYEKLNATDLAENFGFSQLANELRQVMTSPSIQIGKASITRLVIKKTNVLHEDASIQVQEHDIMDEQLSQKYGTWFSDDAPSVHDFPSFQMNSRCSALDTTNSISVKEDISTITTSRFDH